MTAGLFTLPSIVDVWNHYKFCLLILSDNKLLHVLHMSSIQAGKCVQTIMWSHYYYLPESWEQEELKKFIKWGKN